MCVCVCVCVQFLLLKEGEDVNTLRKMPQETILMKWLNFHLEAVDATATPITNFGSDVQV